MSIKINFSVISIVVLTIFIEMVPAHQSKYLSKSSPGIEKYIKLHYVILRKDKKNEESLEKLTNLKELTKHDQTRLYKYTTLSPLPKEIEEKYILAQLQFNDDIQNVEEPIDDFQQFKVTWELYEFNEKIYNQYKSMFNEKDISTDGEINYDDSGDNCADGKINYKDNGETKTMNMFDAFLHFFKEKQMSNVKFDQGMDKNYNLTLNVDINELKNPQKYSYYKKILVCMKNIYNAYCIIYNKKQISKTEFVQKMVDMAETIKQNSNITKEMADLTMNLQEISNDTESTNDFEVIDFYYISCYRNKTCNIPEKVYFKDIMQYFIYLIVENNQDDVNLTTGPISDAKHGEED